MGLPWPQGPHAMEVQVTQMAPTSRPWVVGVARLRQVLHQLLPERSSVSWEQAGTRQVPCSAAVALAQEGAAPELRSINKVSGRNSFNLHFTYWCLLCYFQYGNLIL